MSKPLEPFNFYKRFPRECWRSFTKICLLVIGLFTALVAHAQSSIKFFNVGDIGLGAKSPADVTVAIILQVLQLLGIIVVALIIYGGIRWMLARGNDEEVSKAKEILKASVIGLGIILSSYAIAQYLFQTFTDII